MRVLLADDHAVVRRGLRQILAEEYPGAQFAEAATGVEALGLCDGQAWDLIVLDVWMPGLGGLDVVKQIRRSGRKTPVLIVSLYPESEYGVRALRSGASGYLAKSSAPEELVKAARQVLKGGRYVSEALSQQLAMALDGDGAAAPHESLSNREYEILRHFGSGKRLTEIAHELSLSPKTVGTYRARILEKMKMKTSAQLVQYAIKHGLVEQP